MAKQLNRQGEAIFREAKAGDAWCPDASRHVERQVLGRLRSDKGLAPLRICNQAYLMPLDATVAGLCSAFTAGDLAAGAALHDYLLDRSIPVPPGLVELLSPRPDPKSTLYERIKAACAKYDDPEWRSANYIEGDAAERHLMAMYFPDLIGVRGFAALLDLYRRYGEAEWAKLGYNITALSGKREKEEEERRRQDRERQGTAPPPRRPKLFAVDRDTPIHPVALLIPEMSPAEYAELRADIQANGFDDERPVVLHNGKIVDGRHRFRACRELYVPCFGLAWTEPSGTPEEIEEALVSFALSANIHRRQLSTSQRAMSVLSAGKYLEEQGRKRMQAGGQIGGRGRPNAASRATNEQGVADLPHPVSRPERARDQLADLAKVSPRLIQDAKLVAERSPRLAAEVMQGKKSVNAARREIEKAEKRTELAQQGAVAAEPPHEDVGTAYHEAGHAVMLYLFGMPIEEVSIIPDEAAQTAGHCRKEPGHPSFEADTIVSMAGELAEEKYTGQPCRGDGSDKRKQRTNLKWTWMETRIGRDHYLPHSDKTIQAHRAYLRSLTVDILDKPCVWDAVQGLAQALLEKHRLDGSAAEAVMTAKTERFSVPPVAYRGITGIPIADDTAESTNPICPADEPAPSPKARKPRKE